MAAPVIGTRNRQTQRAVAVDTSHPVAGGLQFCFVPSLGDKEMARGYAATRGAGAIYGAQTGFGAGMSTPSTNTYYLFSGVPDAPFLNVTTVMWVGRPTSPTALQYVIGKRNINNTNNATPFGLYFIYKSPNLTLDLVRGNAGGARITNALPSGGFIANQDTVLVATFPGDISQAATVYVNGLAATTSISGTSSGAATGVGDGIFLGSRPIDSLNSGIVTNITAAWNRQLSQAEAAQLYADPFCFLRY